MRRWTAAAIFLLAACAPKPVEFPVGMYAVSTPAQAEALKSLGFNALQSYQSEPKDVAALASAARQNGQLLLISPDGAMKAGAHAGDFPGAVWYIQDEPDVSRVTPAQLSAHDRRVKAWAPRNLTAFVVGDARKAKDYPGTADVLMEDWYPVPHLPLESSGDMVKRAADAAGGRRVWAVLQAFDWRLSPQHDPSKPRIGRFPTADEIRFMSYDAVLNGAQGVWYFALEPADTFNLQHAPELLKRVADAARQMSALAPVFARGRDIAPPFAPYPGAPAARAWTYHGRDYVILAARPTGHALKCPPELLASRWRPLFENRRDPRDLLFFWHGDYYLNEHRVLVLESRLSPRRLLGL
ncbi:MAG: hypothetical protein HKL90_11000 [Elusimicrobia bacterium]|nr:hypothetical protein [Elusimicrobiota bacterium]